MLNSPRTARLCLLFAFLFVSQVRDAKAERFEFCHEHVLGTSLELVIECESKFIAEMAESQALSEIDRLDKVLSSYRRDSELNHWIRGEHDDPMSLELRQVLAEAETWRLRTDGAFDVRAEAVRELYAAGTPVSASDRHSLVDRLIDTPYRFGATVRKLDNLPVSLNALAKGFILDRVCEVVMSGRNSIKGCLVNIGGDLKLSGTLHAEIQITNPRQSEENASPLASLPLRRPAAVSTSGNYRRTVGAGKVNHIFDPRTGLPVQRVASVTVIADSAVTADAASTAMSVLSVDESLRLAESEELPCMIVLNDGAVVSSANWPQPFGSTNTLASRWVDEDAKVRSGLTAHFTLSANKQGGRYRRPYVAIWLEDEEGFPVKTGLLWLKASNPGPRWHRDLTRWYRNDRIRKLTENIDLIKTISGATRGPGEYSVHFDGSDNSGKPLPAGRYMLCIEVAREHGTYQLLRDKFTWGDEAIKEKSLKPNAEISKASYSFLPTARSNKWHWRSMVDSNQ